jgi:hypothetical protein
MYQKCPVCEGKGKISNFDSMSTDCSPKTCHVCYGASIINSETGVAPYNTCCTDASPEKSLYKENLKEKIQSSNLLTQD